MSLVSTSGKRAGEYGSVGTVGSVQTPQTTLQALKLDVHPDAPSSSSSSSSSSTSSDGSATDSTYVYLSFLFFGAALIYPFKAVSNGGDYFNTEWPDTDLLFYAPTAQVITTPFLQSVGVRLHRSWSYTSLTILPLLGIAAIFSFLPFVPALSPSADASFAFAIALFVLSGILGALVQSSMFALVAVLPPKYVQGIMEGQGWSGLGAVAIRAVIKASLPQTDAADTLRSSGRLFFLSTGIVLVACTLNYLRLRHHPYLLHYAEQADKHPDVVGSLAAARRAGTAPQSLPALGFLGNSSDSSSSSFSSAAAVVAAPQEDPAFAAAAALRHAAAEAGDATPGTVAGAEVTLGAGLGAGALVHTHADASAAAPAAAAGAGADARRAGDEESGLGVPLLASHGSSSSSALVRTASTAAVVAAASDADVEAEAEAVPVSLWQVAREQKVILTHCAFTFALTFLCFPGLMNSLKTPNTHTLTQSWYIIVVNAVYFTFDLVGRAIAKRSHFVTADNIKWGIYPRYALYPVFLLLAYTDHLSHPAYQFTAVVMLAVSNGWFASRVFMVARDVVAPKQRPVIGGLMSVLCVTGVSLGSIVATVIQRTRAH
jgi:hypothetical protein